MRAYDLGLRARVATRTPTRFGTAYRFPEPHVWDLNFAYVEQPAAPVAELVRDADEALAGLGHRMLVVDEPVHGPRLAADLAREGWTVERHVAMLAGPVPAGRAIRQPAREVPPPELLPVRRRASAEEGFDQATLTAIEAADGAVGRAMHERAFASLAADGAIASIARLYTDGQIGQIEDVQTLAAHRGRGHAQSVVLAALAASRAAGHDLTFLWADEDDWPRQLYERLGFSVVGRRWRFRRSVAGATRS